MQGHRPRGERLARPGQPRARDDGPVVPAQVRLRLRLVHAPDRRHGLPRGADPARGRPRPGLRAVRPGRQPGPAVGDRRGGDRRHRTDRPARVLAALSQRDLLGPRDRERGARPRRRARTASCSRTTRPRGGLRSPRRPDRLHRGRVRQRQVRRDQERLRRARRHERRGRGARTRRGPRTAPVHPRPPDRFRPVDDRARGARADPGQTTPQPRSAATQSPRSSRAASGSS